MKNLFDYKYRLYFRTPFIDFSQCKDVLYTNDLEKVGKAIDNVDQQKGYTEYMLITKTENGDIIERNPLDRPKMLVKTPKIN
jgi:hypothetical protein